ncbi:GTPase [Zavarzinia aquatilis]|uniref:G domain-containing protein n=1 Tax=Zavarzinia aquatilis TaxID=2211142 RepID=A0A317E1Y2_9PROT|nr:GTPase [Zavarzinia aquatilis]PWR21097.1 hypothetical protein DKG74_13905 [Zavarzinia aquatilis]
MARTESKASNAVDELLKSFLPALKASVIELEQRRSIVARVDGQIIGTGQADFTTTNTFYTLNFEGKAFQLVDVPGIEGDERRFEATVKQAIARAHLVFYVNGTNKKPEKATAEKIRSYLNRGTQVVPLVNVRGSADAYEFDEDREALESNGSARAALEQTREVLRSALGAEVLLEGHCIQGLLAFSALALSRADNRTTIHPSRDRDLVLQQRNYLKYFRSPEAMRSFSRIDAVAKILHNKLATFKEDIVEANKIKIRELLAENILVLKAAQCEHEEFMKRVAPEFDKCREALAHSLKSFEQLVVAGRKNLWDGFFNKVQEDSSEIVEKYFGDNEKIQSLIQKDFERRQNILKPELENQLKKNVGEMLDAVREALTRLVEDVNRVQFEEQVLFAGEAAVGYEPAELEMSLKFWDYGAILYRFGSYITTGMAAGSVIPGIGTLIGGVAGAMIALVVSAVSYFQGKDARIRRAQSKVRASIEEKREKLLQSINYNSEEILNPVRDIMNDVYRKIKESQENIDRPLKIIQKLTETMSGLKIQLEDMARGSIRPIQ